MRAGGGRRLHWLPPTHLCTWWIVRAEAAPGGHRKALSPVGLGRGDRGTAWRVLLTFRPLSSRLSPLDNDSTLRAVISEGWDHELFPYSFLLVFSEVFCHAHV